MLRHCIAGWLLFCVAFSVQAAPQDPFDGTRLIVKFRDSVHSSERARIEAEHRLTKHRRIPGIGAEVYVVDPRDTPSGIAKKLRDTRSRSIEYTEPDRVANVTFVPSDPQLSSQWHHTTIQSPRAWDTARGDGVTIGVIDTGVDFTHPELAGSVIQGWNFSDDSADVSDGSGHGTMVAGTAAAIGDNLAGVAGVAFRSRILAIRVPPTIEISVLANAIVYAADHGARVANLSYGPVCDSATIGDAARYIRARGGVLVVSAGNEGSESNAEDLPMTCVSAVDQSDVLAPFSSFGSIVDVSAPGVAILTTARGGGYAQSSGTSFAAPIVSGIYAVMFSVNPGLTPFQADQILFSNAKDLGGVGYDRRYGFGRVDAASAVELAAVTGPPSTDTTAPPAPGTLAAAVATTGTVTLSWAGSTDSGALSYYMIYRNGFRIGTTVATSYKDVMPDLAAVFTYVVKAIDDAGNVSPAATVTAAGPSWIALTISRVKALAAATTATVSWSTNKPAFGIVNYQLSTGGPVMTVSAPTFLAAQSVTLPALVKSSQYSYWITASDAAGGTAIGPRGSFRTSAK